MSRKLYFSFLVCISVFIYYVDAFDDSNVENNIKLINSVQSSWKADYNPVFGVDPKVWKRKLGIRLISKQLNKLRKSFVNKLKKSFVNRFLFTSQSSDSSSNIPKNYDLREAWPACRALISSIRDQSACGSCWAVSAASALSDRFCIASNGTYKLPLSAEDLMRCCTKCKPSNDNGCDGGDIVQAMFHLRNEGIVTGGEYGSEEGCIPYSFEPCSNVKGAKCAYAEKGAKTEKCQEKCSNPKYATSYVDDKYFIQDAFSLSKKESVIKRELMQYGSCIATMEVYEDFMYYKSGIYYHVKGKLLGNHGVRLIGWGNENGMDYWLVANSWSSSWGENGLFKIHRTKHACKFGKYIICQQPY